MRETGLDERFTWLALVSMDRCRLLRCRLRNGRMANIEECAVLENEWPQPERGPALRFTRMIGKSCAATARELDNRPRRFIHDVAGWLSRKLARQHAHRIIVVAPPRLLGLLRKAWWGPLANRVRVQAGGLAHLTTGQLGEHPLVVRACAAIDAA